MFTRLKKKVTAKNRIYVFVLVFIVFFASSIRAQQKDEANKIYRFAMELYKDGLLESAITKFKETLDVDPANVDAQYMVGFVYHQMGDNYRAIRELKDIAAYTKAKAVINNSRNMAYFLPGLAKTIDADANYVWVGTDVGISRFDKEKGRWFYYRRDDRWDFNVITALKSDGNVIWVGTQKGLLQLSREDFSQAGDVMLPEVKILSICKDGNTFWILTDENKLYLYDTKTSKLSDKSNIIPRDCVLTSLTSGVDYLWMGTKSGVICTYNKKKAETDVSSSIAEKEIKGLAIDASGPWAFSEGYVFRGKRWIAFDPGFPSGATFDCLDTDGKYLFAVTKNGYTEITGVDLKSEKRVFKFQLPLLTEKELREQIAEGNRQVYISVNKIGASFVKVDSGFIWVGLKDKVYLWYIE